MKQLFLADLKDYTNEEVLNHFVSDYEATQSDIDKYDVIIAYESVGSWGCDSSSFFLLREKETNKFYEIHGSHCSCYGFENQFEPSESSFSYLQSDKFSFWCGGYDDKETENQRLVKEFIQNDLQDWLLQ